MMATVWRRTPTGARRPVDVRRMPFDGIAAPPTVRLSCPRCNGAWFHRTDEPGRRRRLCPECDEPSLSRLRARCGLAPLTLHAWRDANGMTCAYADSVDADVAARREGVRGWVDVARRAIEGAPATTDDPDGPAPRPTGCRSHPQRVRGCPRCASVADGRRAPGS
jgi:hypothetical protein